MSDDAQQQQCPKCNSPYGYSDGQLWVCPECFHEWSTDEQEEEVAPGFADVNGNPLSDGDSVTVIRDLKAGNSTIKSGTKVKKIRLLDEPVNGHDISCKIDGHGHIYLKCSVVKKA
ncbi:zinc ribbon domain-containing protein YjdM [Sansalvadorimonas sp. 2012CJ34-2]|uniref:Zinc ribbon domain-containing protein YjdM n=1 Tax=Parendozoicomonas callyspongiae TaxID=2942213 RepID=A0ABT0PHZ4_9GAMM|nr:zinc ribbon domain-containing protein YjdM [Sansalvadorimonas sp. 2012CJ34-2]MCL6270367.1 zinc ribbon domain-containing protein YjdM [Sansalvadorimonas sp. 2012CJ34-2]